MGDEDDSSDRHCLDEAVPEILPDYGELSLLEMLTELYGSF